MTRQHGVGEPGCTDRFQIGDGRFRPRENDQPRATEVFRPRDVPQSDAGFRRERVEVIEVGDAGQAHDGDIDGRRIIRGGGCLRALQHDRVLLCDAQIVEPRHDAEHWEASARLKVLDRGGQQRRVAAEAVDHEAADVRAFLGREQFHRADEVREHSATVDVTHQQDGCAGVQRDAHVHNVARAQVRFRGAAGALGDHELVLGTQRCESALDGGPEFGLLRQEVGGAQQSGRAAIDDDLRGPVALRLEQHGVHRDGGCQSGGGGLL